jgi:hypothetical protein
VEGSAKNKCKGMCSTTVCNILQPSIVHGLTEWKKETTNSLKERIKQMNQLNELDDLDAWIE